MSQNQEIIESKLCAYIDGELDPEGRAEIEKHLEANPQHRRLLESLRATRDLLRWLPREAAPGEVAETLNGQLERSVLLDYDGDSLRPSNWPRVFAAAAIVVLTAGLGVAVYYALPKSQRPAQLALHTPSADSESTKSAVSEGTPQPEATPPIASTVEPSHEREKVADAMPDGSGDRKQDGANVRAVPGAMTTEPASQPVILADANRSDELDQLARQVAQNPNVFYFAEDKAANALQNTGNSSSNATILLVRSAAPEQTQRQLTTFLHEQRIQYRQSQMPEELRAPEQQNGESSQAVLNASPDPNVSYGPFHTIPTTQPADFGPLEMLPELGAKAAGSTQPGAGPDTRPSYGLAFGSNGSVPGNMTTNNLYKGAVSNEVYICQVSRLQAAQLTSTMSLDGAMPTEVRDVTLNGTADNRAEIKSDRFAGRRQVEAGNAASATSQPVAGAWAMRGAAEQQQQLRARPEAPAPITPAATQPAPGDAGTSPNPSSKPETLARNATTQPAPNQLLEQTPPTTRPADEPVNLVIMIQPAQPPQTQPAK